jgi:hypothetical protein
VCRGAPASAGVGWFRGRRGSWQVAGNGLWLLCVSVRGSLPHLIPSGSQLSSLPLEVLLYFNRYYTAILGVVQLLALFLKCKSPIGLAGSFICALSV